MAEIDQNEFLISFCKHWDDISTRKESIFIPVSFLGLVAIAPRFNQVPPLVIFVVGLASVAVYGYQAYILHLTGLLQSQAWSHLKAGSLGAVAAIVQEAHSAPALKLHVRPVDAWRQCRATISNGVPLSVRQVRHLLLPILGGLWWCLTAYSVHLEYAPTSAFWYLAPGIPLVGLPVLFVLLMRRDMYRRMATAGLPKGDLSVDSTAAPAS